MSDPLGIIGIKPVLQQAEELLAKINETLAEMRAGETQITVTVLGIPIHVSLTKKG